MPATCEHVIVTKDFMPVPPLDPWEVQPGVQVFHHEFGGRVMRHAVTRPDGKPGVFYVTQKSDCCKVIAVTTDGNIVMIGRYHVATSQWSIETPGGNAREGEARHDTAMRELLAETGYGMPDDEEPVFECLANGHQLNGVFPARTYAYVLRGVVRREDATERALTHGTQVIYEVPIEQVIACIDKDRYITCSVDQALLERFFRRELWRITAPFSAR